MIKVITFLIIIIIFILTKNALSTTINIYYARKSTRTLFNTLVLHNHRFSITFGF